MATGGSLKDLVVLRQFLVQKRHFAKSITWTPRLKEILNPPPPITERKKPKSLPKLEDIKIPRRIDRSPTDILKALASTVGRDYTAPHYKFHDDPYLIPYSNMNKRSYALSKEAGRKAAKWVREKHADLFQHQTAEPPVEAYFPSPVFTEDSVVTQEDLVKYIEQGLLSEAIQIYDLLKKKGQEINDETKQAFLELLCYFNEVGPIEEDLVEERWFRQANFMRDRVKNTWRDGGLAESLFHGMENPSISAYCAMIRGQAKFFNSEKAWVTYTEVKSKGLILDTETYNALIRVVNFVRENADLRMALIEEVVIDMKERGIQPNLGTLNAMLESFSMMGNPRLSKTMALSTMAEFKNIGIEPSLASYYYLLTLFCKEKGPMSTILVDIMKTIKCKEFTSQDPRDTAFFTMAMDVARNHLQNVELAHEVDDLLHTGNNYDLIGDSYKESVYYRHYMALRCNFEPFEDFMKFYDKIVPNIYTPEPGITEEILQALEINTALTYLPRVWSDLVIFDQTNRDHILELVLHIMASSYPTSENSDIAQPEKLAEQFTKIGWQIWEIVEGQDRERERGRQVNWSGKMLGDLMTLQISGDQFDNACEVIKKLLSPNAISEVVGVPSIEALKLFLDTSIANTNGAMCLACLQYMNECGFPEVGEFGQEVFEKVKLDSLQTAKLSSITGRRFSLKDVELEREQGASKQY